MAVWWPETFSTEGQPSRTVTEGGEPLLNTIKGLPMACDLFEGNVSDWSQFSRGQKLRPFRKQDKESSRIMNNNKSIRTALTESLWRSSPADSESPFHVTQGCMISIEQMDAHSPCFNARRQLLFLYNSLFILEGRQEGEVRGQGRNI